MKNLIFLLTLFVTSCSCVAALSGKKGPGTDIVSSTDFSVQLLDEWYRTSNGLPVRLPSPSYGDITLFNNSAGSIIILSSIEKIDNTMETLESLGNALSADVSLQSVSLLFTAEIKNAIELNFRMNNTKFRIIMVNGPNYTHVIQCITTSDQGVKSVSDVLKTFKF